MARLADPGLAERRRRQILDAALTCFRRRGFHQATMQEICAEAGISPGALYRYFDSKSGIIAAIAEDDRREVDQALVMCAGGRLIDALCLLAERVLARFADEGFASIFAEVFAEAARDPELGRRLSEFDAVSAAHFAKALSEAQARGEIDRALDPRRAAHMLIATLTGLALRSGRREHDAAILVKDFRALAARYLAAQP